MHYFIAKARMKTEKPRIIQLIVNILNLLTVFEPNIFKKAIVLKLDLQSIKDGMQNQSF